MPDNVDVVGVPSTVKNVSISQRREVKGRIFSPLASASPYWEAQVLFQGFQLPSAAHNGMDVAGKRELYLLELEWWWLWCWCRYLD